MQIDINVRSDTPIYIQIVEQVRLRIAEGDLRPGDQLPTVRAMASDLRVNFNTVARAYRMLDEAGVISTQQGRGTYILEEPSPDMAEKLRRESLVELARRFLSETRRLGYSPQQAAEIFQQASKDWKKDFGSEEYQEE